MGACGSGAAPVARGTCPRPTATRLDGVRLKTLHPQLNGSCLRRAAATFPGMHEGQAMPAVEAGVEPSLAAELELAAVPHEELVRRLYRLCLRREPEPDALQHAATKLTAGTLSRATLIRDVVTSEEFESVRVLDDAVAFAAWARANGERPRELTAPPGSDERAIETSWCLARYRGEARVLDVGYAFAKPAYLAALVNLGAPALVAVDIADAVVPGVKSVRADVRSLPLERNSFDVVFCISTLEHVGADDDRYGRGLASGGIDEALRELRRVGGRILITVPSGEPGDYGWFVQDEPDGWRTRFRDAGFLVFEDELYELTSKGWRAAESIAAGVRYGERGPGASAVLCAELHRRTPTNRLREAIRRRRSPTSE
jgi:SAM-dependent methyltransferase